MFITLFKCSLNYLLRTFLSGVPGVRLPAHDIVLNGRPLVDLLDECLLELGLCWILLLRIR